jgi:hypothetical protein
MVLGVDVTVVYGRWRKVASVAADASSNHSGSLTFGAEDTTTLTSFSFYLFMPNYAPATLLLDAFFKGHVYYYYFYLTNADLEIKYFKVSRRYYAVDLGKPRFAHLSYGMFCEVSISLYYFEIITKTVMPTPLPISSLV